MKWADCMEKSTRGDRVIVASDETGLWIKISKECFELLDDAVKRGLSEEELLKEFEAEEDRDYIKQLINKLDTVGVWDKPADKSEPKIKQVYFMITHRCNLCCAHCSIAAEQSNGEDYLDTKRIVEAMERVIKLRPAQIALSGGEPLVRKDYKVILEYLRRNYEGVITLMTNGTLINEDNVDFIVKNISNIDLSIDGIDEETCSLIRGKGVFDKVISVVKMLQARGMNKISLSMVFGSANYHLMKPFRELNERLGTRAVPRAFSPIGRGKDLEKYFETVPEGQHVETLQDKLEDMVTAFSCKACRHEICIDPHGDLYPCVLLTDGKYKLGNIFVDEDINAINGNGRLEERDGYKHFIDLLPQRIEKCKDCDLNLFCWSCLHFVDYYKDSDLFEKRCLSKKSVLGEAIWGG